MVRLRGSGGPADPSESAGQAQARAGFVTREAGLVLIAAAGAWAATVVLARGMAGMTGTMGLGVAVFVAVWTLMMTAMMLPSVAPTASLYAKTVRSNRTVRIAALVAGYLAVWAAAGVPAFGLAWLAGWLTEASRRGARAGRDGLRRVRRVPAEPAQGPLPGTLPLPAGAALALRLLPGQVPRH